MNIYRCDNGECKQEASDLDSWLNIGTETNDLFITNNTSFVGLKEMGRHNDIHFCSAKCFIKFLFGDGLVVTLINIKIKNKKFKND